MLRVCHIVLPKPLNKRIFNSFGTA